MSATNNGEALEHADMTMLADMARRNSDIYGRHVKLTGRAKLDRAQALATIDEADRAVGRFMAAFPGAMVIADKWRHHVRETRARILDQDSALSAGN